jgi:MFS family permease
MEARAAGTVFGRSWHLLVRNGSIVVPGIVVGVLAGIVQYALVADDTTATGTIWMGLVLWVVQIVAAILSITYTTGMANVAWQAERAHFADGRRAFRRDAGHVFVAMLVLFALGAIAALLAPFTFSISLLVYAFFCIYTMASAVVGERSGLRAVLESAEIASGRPFPTLLMVAGIAIVAVIAGAIALLLSAAPLIGPLVAQLVVQIVIAYVVLVVVGEYRALRGTGPAA